MAERIQRQRTRGWRTPPGSIYVGRPTAWGNPFTVKPIAPIKATMWAVWFQGKPLSRWDTKELATADAVERHRLLLRESPTLRAMARAELAGKDLVCWCRVGTPCHGDALLEIAGGSES
jgi:Domain of unknown function (DUF4326)